MHPSFWYKEGTVHFPFSKKQISAGGLSYWTTMYYKQKHTFLHSYRSTLLITFTFNTKYFLHIKLASLSCNKIYTNPQPFLLIVKWNPQTPSMQIAAFFVSVKREDYASPYKSKDTLCEMDVGLISKTT